MFTVWLNTDVQTRMAARCRRDLQLIYTGRGEGLERTTYVNQTNVVKGHWKTDVSFWNPVAILREN